jgi:hypothetical protein
MDGGFTNDDALAQKIRGIVNHGMYERYHHDVVGVNSRLIVFRQQFWMLNYLCLIMVAQDKMRHVNIQLHLKGIRIS